MTALPGDIVEQVVASRVIFGSAGAASSKLDTFSSWLMLSYAAAIGLLLDKGDKYLPGATLHCLIELFFAVAVCGIVAKYLYVLVSGASAGNVLGREAATGAGELNLQVFTAQMLNGLPQPARFIVRRMLRKALAGSFMGPPRFLFCLLQVQAALTLAQVMCLVGAIYIVSHNATFGGSIAEHSLWVLRDTVLPPCYRSAPNEREPTGRAKAEITGNQPLGWRLLPVGSSSIYLRT